MKRVGFCGFVVVMMVNIIMIKKVMKFGYGWNFVMFYWVMFLVMNFEIFFLLMEFRNLLNLFVSRVFVRMFFKIRF